MYFVIPDAINKIREQLGETDILTEDPTEFFARDVRKVLCTLNKKGRFSKKVYEAFLRGCTEQ